MKLSTRSRYGARILLDLARNCNQGPVQIGEISKRQDISVKYLEQLIRPLKQANLVNSVRGPKGGPAKKRTTSYGTGKIQIKLILCLAGFVCMKVK